MISSFISNYFISRDYIKNNKKYFDNNNSIKNSKILVEFNAFCASHISFSYLANVIATKNVGVHSSLITHLKNGYLFEVGNVNELENLLSKAIKNEIPHLGKQAREEIITNWSAKKEADNLMAVYNS